MHSRFAPAWCGKPAQGWLLILPRLTHNHSKVTICSRKLGDAMKSFVIACAVAIVVALGSAYVLNAFNQTAEHAFSSRTGVRV